MNKDFPLAIIKLLVENLIQFIQHLWTEWSDEGSYDLKANQESTKPNCQNRKHWQIPNILEIVATVVTILLNKYDLRILSGFVDSIAEVLPLQTLILFIKKQLMIYIC